MNMEGKKAALRLFQYGLFIYTSKSTSSEESQPYAASTVTWVSQASFEPPLVMVALRRDSWSHETTKQSGIFALNILGADQKAMAGKFFKELSLEGNKLNGFEFQEGSDGAPIFSDAIAALECRVTDRVERGDHTVVVGNICEARVTKPDAVPLSLSETGWKYGG